MLSGAHATLGRHVSTWAHAVLGGKVSSLGFSGEKVSGFLTRGGGGGGGRT
jgi:hypothetical protein